MKSDKNDMNDQSQDAIRHEKDAAHHKLHKDRPLSQQNSDPQPSEGQPEIPKVGSRDAPGG